MKLIDLLKRKNLRISDYARALGVTYQQAFSDCHLIGGPKYLKRFLDLLDLVGVDALSEAPKIVAKRPKIEPKRPRTAAK